MAEKVIAFKERFEEIRRIRGPLRSIRLASLKSDMDKVYKTSLFFHEEYRKRHPLEAQLYRDILFIQGSEKSVSI